MENIWMPPILMVVYSKRKYPKIVLIFCLVL